MIEEPAGSGPAATGKLWGIGLVNIFIKKWFRAVAIFSLLTGAASPALADDSANAVDASDTILAASFTAAAARLKESAPDQKYERLFNAWERMDGVQPVAATIAIPSLEPVAAMRLTSHFGTRSDPFTGRAKAHKGIDIPGAIGTPIYATADGIIAKAEWFGGYGNFIQIAHGNSIETRYGHMSRLNVQAGDRVRKGQIIGFMGSTGRSTGSHLHYEVRIDGDAVNPLSFVPPRDIMLAARDESAVGGPSND
ncbi:MAG: M23 family metallopeptidase [Sphingomonadales bacterium]|nr:M23 family metallopeptidase [Sphingomonadales bacterium]